MANPIRKALASAFAKMYHLAAAPEGAWRPTAGISELGNSFLIPWGDGFQRNLNGNPYDANGTVMACVMTIARVLSASYPNHARVTAKGGREIVTTGAAHRLLMRPNVAQNAMDWVGWTVFNLMLNGNAYYYVKRNDRNEPIELIPLAPKGQRGFIAPNGELYYDISVSADFYQTLDTSMVVPARDIVHIKLPSRRSVINGESSIEYALGAISVNSTIQASASAFTANMSRPSGILSTDLPLTPTQMSELRDAFDAVSKGANQGKVPVLGNGLSWNAMGVNAHDSQLLEMYNTSVLDICRIFGVPIELLGVTGTGTNKSVSALIGQFKAGSLLYVAELIEFSMEELFKFDHLINTVRFDFDNVARADFETEINTLSKGTQNGIFSPNEARNRVGLDSVPYGDEPRVQAQNVRLEDAVPAPVAPSAGKAKAPSNQGDGSGPVEDTGTDNGTGAKYMDGDYVVTKLQGLIEQARKEIIK